MSRNIDPEPDWPSPNFPWHEYVRAVPWVLYGVVVLALRNVLGALGLRYFLSRRCP